MQLEKLNLHHFRNYEKEEVYFGPDTNIIHGNNAQGKTNLLEALSLLSTGKSFRTPHLQDMIRHGASFFRIEAHFHKEGVYQTLSISFDGKSRKILHNDTSYASFISLFGILPTILIVPEDVAIIAGSPTDRRKFLDLHIAQIDPLYVYHLGRYYRGLKQRNFLLKKKEELSLSSWEAVMAPSAAYIALQRKVKTRQLALLAKKHLIELAEGKDELEMQYFNPLAEGVAPQELAGRYLEQWKKTRKRELLLGSTLFGPHRDDLHFFMHHKEAKLFASEGQKRGCVTALRLAQRELYEEHLGSSPLMGIDDFGIHLDSKIIAFLLAKLEKLGQTFLTSPAPMDAFQKVEKKHLIAIANGSIARS